MKRILVITLVLLVLLAAGPTVKLMRFEVVNKSGQNAVVILNEVSFDQDIYPDFYLSIPAGGVLPEVRLFTVPQGVYDLEVIACGELQPSQFVNLDLHKGYFRFVILPCELRAAKDGDGVLKFNPLLYPYEDLYGVPQVYNLGGVYKWRY